MNFQELSELKKLVDDHQNKMDYYIRSRGEYILTGKGRKEENSFNLYAVLRKASIHGRDTILEKQAGDADYRGEEENRFLEDFLIGDNPSGKFDRAVGNPRIEMPKTQSDFDRLSEGKRRILEKSLFKSLVVSCAQLLNALNRMPRTNDIYEKKNTYIAEYLAYAELFNAKFPEEQMAFGFDFDSAKDMAVLTGSVPGYSRFSVHLGAPITAANILFDTNKKIFSQAPLLGFSYSNSLQSTISQKSLAYVNYGEYELIDNDNKARKLKTYNLTDIRRNFNRYNAERKQFPKGPLSDGDRRYLEQYKENISSAIRIFSQMYKYPLDINEINTGIVNCYNGNGVKKYSDLISKTKDDLELDIAFNMIFAEQNFNKRERMYIAERAGLPLSRLKKVQEFKRERRDDDFEKTINSFVASRTKNMSKEEKIDFLKKIGKVYRYSPIEEVDRNLEFLDALDASTIGIAEESLEQYKVDELLLLYSENKKNVQELLNNSNYAITLMQTLTENNAMNKLFEVMSIGHISELFQSINAEDLELGNFSQLFSAKVKMLSQEEIEEILNPEEFEMFRFEAIIKNIDDDTKKDFLSKTAGAVSQREDADNLLRTTIMEMDTDDQTIERTLSMYDQIRGLLGETTKDSRQDAQNVELSLEEKEQGTVK